MGKRMKEDGEEGKGCKGGKHMYYRSFEPNIKQVSPQLFWKGGWGGGGQNRAMGRHLTAVYALSAFGRFNQFGGGGGGAVHCPLSGGGGGHHSVSKGGGGHGPLGTPMPR